MFWLQTDWADCIAHLSFLQPSLPNKHLESWIWNKKKKKSVFNKSWKSYLKLIEAGICKSNWWSGVVCSKPLTSQEFSYFLDAALWLHHRYSWWGFFSPMGSAPRIFRQLSCFTSSLVCKQPSFCYIFPIKTQVLNECHIKNKQCDMLFHCFNVHSNTSVNFINAF